VSRAAGTDRRGRRVPARTHISGVGSGIRRDLRNAGFAVHDDDAVVLDEQARLLTARDPRDLGPLCEAVGRELAAIRTAASPPSA
jgi:protease I